MRKLVWLTVMVFAAVGSCHAQELSAKVIYDKDQLLPGWTATATEGAALEEAKQGIAFRIDAWKEGRDLWPRMWLVGPGVDLSDYNKLVAEIENPTDGAENIAMGARQGPEDNTSQTWLLPARSTTEVVLNISDGVQLNQSDVREILFYIYYPTTVNHFIVKKVSAIRDPAFTARRTALGAQLAEAERGIGLLRKMSRSANTGTGLQSVSALLQSARQQYRETVPGYSVPLQKELYLVQENIERTAVDMRGSALWLWSSPLGIPVRKDTLPPPDSKALTRIRERVCLNQYKAICLNFSAGAKAQDLNLKLRAPAGPSNLFSLRPTFFVTAHDGTETADAIGESTSEIAVKIEPYQARQVLIWVNTKTPDIRAGKYAAAVEVTVAGETRSPRRIPINIEVVAVRLAANTPTSLHNWAYFYIRSSPITAGLEKEAVANLRDYGINTFSQDYSQIPLPRLNAAGQYEGLDPAGVESYSRLLELEKGDPAESQILWLGFQRAEVVKLLNHPGVLEGYLRDLHALLDRYQIPLDKRYLQLWDAPKLPEVRESIGWMRRIRALDPTFRFYDNGSSLPPGESEFREYVDLADCWLPHWDNVWRSRPEDVKKLAAAPVRHLGFHRHLLARTNRGVNIYEYYRLMNWRLIERGLDSLAFWSYNVGADSWDDTKIADGGGNMVYRKDGKLLTSRRWELFREGVEDYKLAQAAVGVKGVIRAGDYPQLARICKEIANHSHDAGYADRMRTVLIDLALKQKRKAG